MSDYTDYEFKIAMAKLAGLQVSINGTHYHPKGGGMHPIPDYYNDLNFLLPLAWKHGMDLDQELDGTWSAKAYRDVSNPMHGVIDIIQDAPEQAVRDCLWSIAQERKQ